MSKEEVEKFREEVEKFRAEQEEWSQIQWKYFHSQSD